MTRPLRQGEMDELCGVYAILNAIRLLAPKAPVRDTEVEIFGLLVDKLSKKQPVSELLWDGVKFNDMEKLAGEAIKYSAKHLDCDIQCRRLPRRPSPKTLDEYWEYVRIEVKKGAVAIIRLKKIHDHWTLVRNATPKRFSLFDSVELSHLDKSNCSLEKDAHVRHHIVAGQTLFLSNATVHR